MERLGGDKSLKQLCFRPSMETINIKHDPHTTIGEIANATAEKIATTIDDNPAFREAFQKANGKSEFYMDGTCLFLPLRKPVESLLEKLQLNFGTPQIIR